MAKSIITKVNTKKRYYEYDGRKYPHHIKTYEVWIGDKVDHFRLAIDVEKENGKWFRLSNRFPKELAKRKFKKRTHPISCADAFLKNIGNSKDSKTKIVYDKDIEEVVEIRTW